MQKTTAQAPESPFNNRDVIRTATLEVRVKDIDEAERAASKIIAGQGGYVENVGSTDLASADAKLTLTTRVPVRSFEDVIRQFEDLGVRLSKTVSAQDVTKQLIDVNARIKTLQVEEEIARNMLRKATDVNQIFELRNKLAEMRTAIETMSGERKGTKELADLSTITVTLRQGSVPPAKQDPSWFAQSYGEASGNAFGVFRWLATAALYLALFSPIWGSALFVGWLIYKGQRKTKVVQA